MEMEEGSQYCLMEVTAGTSQKDGNIFWISEEAYWEWFTVLLMIMAYGEQDTILSFCELSTVKETKIRRLRWLAHLFRVQELVRAKRLPFFNQKALDV